MSKRRKRLNVILILFALILGGLVAWLYRLPPLVLTTTDAVTDSTVVSAASPAPPASADSVAKEIVNPGSDTEAYNAVNTDAGVPRTALTLSSYSTADMLTGHPFSAEARKVLGGRLEVTDSLNRQRILQYCEQLRTSYNTRDIDFIRQVYSDNALIIVGHIVRAGKSPEMSGFNTRVQYSIRTKQAYVERLNRIFKSGKRINVKFSDFRIMRHPTSPDIYGVTLRQGYTCGSYSDDGYLFLLWDFRNTETPQIYVRTWQPAPAAGADDIIDLSDFNLE